MTVTLVVVPVTLVVVSSLVGHLALALLHAFGPLALVDGAILVAQFTVTVTHAVNPISLILDALLVVYVDTLSVSEAVHDLTLVGGAIGPLIASSASDFVLAELPLVNRVVSPLERAFSVQQTVSQFSLVLVAIFKNTGALTVVHFADLIAKAHIRHKLIVTYLTILLIVNLVASPILDDQFRQLLGQKSNARQRLYLHNTDSNLN